MPKTITKAALCEHLATTMAFDKPVATRLVEAFFQEMSEVLAMGENVKLTGLGSFTLTQKSARFARNFETKAAVFIPARKVVTFKAGQMLKEKVKQSNLGVE